MKIRKVLEKLKAKKKSLGIILAVVAIAAALGISSKYYLGADNFIEEKCEEIIESQTGFNIDLSPSSKEYTDRFFRAS